MNGAAMAKQSHIYVIAFESGTLKVGRAADGLSRLATHRREAGRHGVEVVDEWCSPPCGENTAVLHEQSLLTFCASKGRLRAGAEYFEGVDFVEVVQFAEELIAKSWSVPPESQPTSPTAPRWKMRQQFKTVEPEPVSGPSATDPLAGAGDTGRDRDIVKEKVHGRMPTQEEITVLDLPPGEPVVEVEHVIRTPDGTVLEYGRTIFPGSRVQIVREFKRLD